MSQELYTFLLLLAMLGGFGVAFGIFKMPAPLSLAFSALVGALAAGLGIPVRHFLEGTFGFFDIAVIVLTASIFIEVQRRSLGLNTLVQDIIRVFHKIPSLLLIVLMFVIVLPGALAGSGTASVMAVGGLVATILARVGLSHLSITAFVGMGGILALLAPPINIPAMIIASGLNMPYAGFFGPLLALTIFLGVVAALYYGLREVDKRIDAEKLISEVTSGEFRLGRLGAYLPLIVVIGLFALQRLAPRFPDPGIPLIFVIGIAVGMAVNTEKFNFLEMVRSTIKRTGPVAAIFVSVGMLVQIMVTTGVRGLIVIESTTAPIILLYLAVAFLIPAMGGVMGTYGVASIFAIPFMMALLAQDVIFAIAGLSVLCCLASLTPPTAIVGRAAVLVSEWDGPYSAFLRASAVPWAIVCASGVLTIILANWLRAVF